MGITLIAICILQATLASCFTMHIENSTTVYMGETVIIPFNVTINNFESLICNKISNTTFVKSSDTGIVTVQTEFHNSKNQTICSGEINVTGIFLGSAEISIKTSPQIPNDVISVIVKRKKEIIDRVFTVSVEILVSILYINFGCAMNWKVCKEMLKKPIGIALGCFCQFVFMPLSAYCIGLLLFPERPDLRIGIFFTGISPSGEASNIWTVLLGGNLNLSIAMTTIVILLSFGTMPLWIFTLGKRILEQGEFGVPYSLVAYIAMGLVIPLAIGFFIQKKFPKLCKLMIRIMKPFSIILIVFIIVFAIATNLYLFKLFSWQILVSGMALPWLGFLFGLLLGVIFKRPKSDIIAIAVETGIQNTGVSIFLLRFSLTSPADDLTTVVPVSAAIMTALPLTILYVIKLISNRVKKTKPDNASMEKFEGEDS